MAAAWLAATSFACGSVADFQPLDPLLPSPNARRTATGAPGPEYWQQRADYTIEAELDEAARSIRGRARITYHNHSPDTLMYLWLGLDRNFYAADADNRLARRGGAPSPGNFSYAALDRILAEEEFDGGFNLHEVADAAGNPLAYTVVKTMMRVDLPRPLQSGESFQFSIAWDFLINDARRIGTRTGYEEFASGVVFAIAHWFPRMAAYTDYGGWRTSQYLGTGEFTLEFGDFDVSLTVPDDHAVAATGVLRNPEEVLTEVQRARLAEAETAERPVFIVTPDEAEAAMESRPKGMKTWRFRADNVRDFAFASSRVFVWDAMAAPGLDRDGKPVMAMSLYPREGMPLWDRYATHAVAHTLDVYSRYTFPYPYPVAIAILGGVGSGMEYPMICFNGPHPEEDGTYPARTKYGLISVIIHEVGHFFLPMVVNSDERQWMWLDEGLNSFLQFLAESEWEEDYPSRRGPPDKILSYMRQRNRVPVMTTSDSLAAQGDPAYSQPAVALNLLREIVLGRELFDYAFQMYARRWQFKRPTPADFFRTIEDASGRDLSWFWNGWFFSADHVDIAIEGVRRLRLDTRDPDIEKPKKKAKSQERPATLTVQRNAATPKRVDAFPELKDFYNEYDEYAVTDEDRKKYRKLLEELEEKDIDPALLLTDRNFYLIDFKNVGGIVMPLILDIRYADGTSEERWIPADIWRYDTKKASYLLLTEKGKEMESIGFDPREELTDTNSDNNSWPRRFVDVPFQLKPPETRDNPMREAKEKQE